MRMSIRECENEKWTKTCLDRLYEPFRSDIIPAMHEALARDVLKSARTPQERQAAVARAIELGMPISQIEEFLDWLDGATSELDDVRHPKSPNGN